MDLFLSGRIFTNAELTEEKREQVALMVALLLRIIRIDMRHAEKALNVIPPIADELYDPNQWLAILLQFRMKFDLVDDLDCKKEFVRLLQTWTNYGCQFFICTASNDPKCPQGCVLAINGDGVKLMDPKTRASILSYTCITFS